jgi:hypothetical protein
MPQRRRRGARTSRRSGNRLSIARETDDLGVGVALSDGLAWNPKDLLRKPHSNLAPRTVPRNIADQVHWFEDVFNGSGFTTSTTLDTFGALTLRFDTFSQAFEYAAVFDEFCIVKAVVKIVCNTTNSTPTTNGIFYSAIDLTDDTPPNNTVAVEEYTGCITTQGQVGHEHVFRPMANAGTWANPGTTGVLGLAPTQTWLRCYNSTVGALDATEHYGIKFAHTVTTGSTLTYNIRARVTLAFRFNHGQDIVADRLRIAEGLVAKYKARIAAAPPPAQVYHCGKTRPLAAAAGSTNHYC